MDNVSQVSNDNRLERIETLRLKVKAAVVIGVGLSTMQDYLRELHALTLQPASFGEQR